MHVMFAELNTTIAESDVKNAIKDLKSGKSGGEDLLINEFFVSGQNTLLKYIVPLFNYVFKSGIFPKVWSDGLLVPLHKKGSYSKPENFRGITLLSVLGKLFTRVINTRLNIWAEKYGVYVEAQYGFRTGRGTVDCVFILQNVISNFIQNGKKLYALFVDYSKAFDYIVRENLWYKLINLGIKGEILDIIRSMYNCVKTRVFTNGEKSDTFCCNLGVRQGECLSPFLFSMYVNDLEEKLAGTGAGVTFEDMKILLLFYADDVVIFSESAQGLQSGINSLHEYCNRWKLKLNTEKSKVMVFRKGKSIIRDKWFFGDKELSIATKLPYLGVIFTSNGSFAVAQTTLADKAGKAVYLLYRRISQFKNLKPKYMLDLFDKYISPILNYGCEVWGFQSSPHIERVHLKFCKSVLGVKTSTQNDFVYGELERVPMQIIRYFRIVKYWLKIVHGMKSYYVSRLYYTSLQNIDRDNKPNWVRSVKTLLLTHGFGEVWYNQGVGDIDAFVKLFKQRSFDMYKQDWNSRLQDSSRARFYRSIKPLHSYSLYLNIVVPKQHRMALCRLIVSSHSLKCESGRWARPVVPAERRYCFKCPNKIEDEYHFLVECSMYTDIRRELIPRYYWTCPSMFKVQQLFSITSPRVLKGLAKYVFLAFKIRQSEISENN